MYIDNELLLSDAQDLSQAIGTYDSTHAVDLTVAGRDVGKGEQVHVVVVIDQTFASAGAATLTIQLVTADDATLDTNVTTILSTPALGLANLAAGRDPIVIPIPPGIARRYLGLNYVIGVATTTAGQATAFVTMDVQTNL